MKVYIGPYGNKIVCNLYDKYFKWKYPKDYLVRETQTTFERHLENFEKFIQKILNKTVNRLIRDDQKIKVRIDNYDVWSMDSTLAHIILPMLKKLQEIKPGSPTNIDDHDVPASLKEEDCHKKWDYVLSEMIWAFEQINREDRESQFYSGDVDFIFEPRENGLSEIKCGPNHTFKVDSENLKKYEDKIQGGLNLFTKYYFSLWH